MARWMPMALEFGHYFSVTVQKKFGSELWRIEINMRFAGECETKEEAFAVANQRVTEAAREFVEDWAIWTVGQRYPKRLPKGW
jgi:hypothetical protein